MNESSTYQEIFAEGIEKGIEKGIEIAFKADELRGGRRLLMRVGRQRFGEPDETLLESIYAIDSIEGIERLADRMYGASSWQELVAL